MYNEQSTVCVGRALDVARDDHTTIDCNGRGRPIDNLQAVIHFSCPIAEASLRPWTPRSFDGAGWLDGAFSTDAVKVRLDIDMYQCKEQKHTKTEKRGEKQIETVSWTYQRSWESSHISSRDFKAWDNSEARRALENGCGYDFQENAEFPMASRELSAPSLLAGVYDLSRHLGKVNADAPVQLTEMNFNPPWRSGLGGRSGHRSKRMAQDGQEYTRGEFIDYYGQKIGEEKWENARESRASQGGGLAQVSGSMVYTCSPGSPELGCVRVGFKKSSATRVSFLGSLAGTATSSWTAPASWMCSSKSTSNKVELFAAKANTAYELVDAAESSNVTMTWILRLVGITMAVMGIRWFFSPIATLASLVDQFFDWFKFIPLAGSMLDFLGDVVSGAVGMALMAISVGIGLPSALTVLSLTWCVMRPWIGIPMLVTCGCSLVYTYKRMSEYAQAGKEAKRHKTQ